MLAGLALPLVVLSQSSAGVPSAFDILRQDLKLLRPGAEVDSEDQRYDDARADREKGSELFPDLAWGGSSSAGSAGSSAPSGQFLTFRERGRDVVLRDVPRQAWFFPYVRDMVARKVLGGYRDASGAPLGEFRPGNPVTVEELAKMAILAARITAESCGESRNPTAKESWSSAFVACGESRQWSLFVESSVDVRRPATRAEVVVTVLQAFGVDTTNVALAGSGSLRDINGSMSFGAAIERAVRDGVVAGYGDGTFRPGLPINRAETAKILSLAVQVYAR